MKYNPKIHNRISMRLKCYDYSQEGAYFITICCKDRACLFGEIINGEMILNANGNIAYNEWLKTTEIRSNVELDVFVPIAIGMPNHIHGIVIINNDRRGVLHTSMSISHLANNGKGVLHTPSLIIDKCDDNKQNALKTCVVNNTHSSVVNNIPATVANPGVCNTRCLKNVNILELQKPNVLHTPDINNIPTTVTNQVVCNTPLRFKINL